MRKIKLIYDLRQKVYDLRCRIFYEWELSGIYHYHLSIIHYQTECCYKKNFL